MLVPLNTPIASVVPPGRQIMWAASRVSVAPASSSEIAVVCTFVASTKPAWSLLIDVAGGDPDLATVGWGAIVVADRYLLIKTEAQSSSGQGTRKSALHRVGSDGRLMWSLATSALDQVGLLDDKLVIVHQRDALSASLSRLPLAADLCDPKTGQALASHAVAIPDHLWPRYEGAPVARLHAILEHDGRHFAVRVSLEGGANTASAQDSVFLYVLPFQQTVVRRWGFVCPDCLRPGALQIVQSIQLAPDNRSDDIVVQVIACSQCSFRGLAAYEESRRGALDAEGWQHTGYRAGEDAMQNVTAAINRCPNPSDARCTCATHAGLGQKDDAGRWQGLSNAGGSFPMRLVDAHA